MSTQAGTPSPSVEPPAHAAQTRLVAETKRRLAAEKKHHDLLGTIARAVVLELRRAKYIEIHDQSPIETEATK